MNKKTIKKIEEMAGVPYQFGVNIEFDREVITVGLVDNWRNKKLTEVVSVDRTIDQVIATVYKEWKLLRRQV